MTTTVNGSMLPPEYDDIHPRGYDPVFTTDINTKMRIPDTLAANSSDDVSGAFPMSSVSEELSGSTDRLSAKDMTVPEKIVIAGQNRHIGTRPDVNLQPDFIAPTGTSTAEYVGLVTPPQVLTVSDEPTQSMPSQHGTHNLDDERAGSDSGYPDSQFSFHANHVAANHLQTMEDHDVKTSSDGLLLTGNDNNDFLIMQRQMRRLTLQVNTLLDDNTRRAQRELFLYPVIMGYFLYKMASWFMR